VRVGQRILVEVVFDIDLADAAGQWRWDVVNDGFLEVSMSTFSMSISSWRPRISSRTLRELRLVTVIDFPVAAPTPP
jgi:hypothetical protein